MNCRTAEGMVNGYINHELSLKELEEFLDHIQTCSSCYDELETYFIVHEAMQQLDDNDSGSVMDFKRLLEQDIRKSRRYIRKKKLGQFFSGSPFVYTDRGSGSVYGICGDADDSYYLTAK